MIQCKVRQETLAMLAEIETLLAILENNPEDLEAINQVYRAWNTLGVLGGIFHNTMLEALGREMARAFDLLRCTLRPADPEILRLARTTQKRIHMIL